MQYHCYISSASFLAVHHISKETSVFWLCKTIRKFNQGEVFV